MAPAPFDPSHGNPTFDAAPRVEGEPFILFCRGVGRLAFGDLVRGRWLNFLTLEEGLFPSHYARILPDKYGRTLGVLRAGGRGVARILISEQLGVSYSGAAHRLVPTPGDTTVNSERATF